jgi:hypothetical protein
LVYQPFHHDCAAFNPQRAKHQNITVGVSFGATRELAFIRAAPEHLQHDIQFQHHQEQHQPCRIYFPQTNNGVFTFGRDVNIHWKHGINALPPSQQSHQGRISIILWGLARNVVDEPNSPPLLGADGQGPHANHKSHHHHQRLHNRHGHEGRYNDHGHDHDHHRHDCHRHDQRCIINNNNINSNNKRSRNDNNDRRGHGEDRQNNNYYYDDRRRPNRNNAHPDYRGRHDEGHYQRPPR